MTTSHKVFFYPSFTPHTKRLSTILIAQEREQSFWFCISLFVYRIWWTNKPYLLILSELPPLHSSFEDVGEGAKYPSKVNSNEEAVEAYIIFRIVFSFPYFLLERCFSIVQGRNLSIVANLTYLSTVRAQRIKHYTVCWALGLSHSVYFYLPSLSLYPTLVWVCSCLKCIDHIFHTSIPRSRYSQTHNALNQFDCAVL